MGVTPERIPLQARAEDGNLSDKVWNRAFIQRMRALLTQEEWQQLVYVADSALVTKTNLCWMQEQDLHFVSRLPDTFALGEEVKQAAWEQGNWQEAGTLRPGNKAAIYRWQAFIRSIEGRPYPPLGDLLQPTR